MAIKSALSIHPRLAFATKAGVQNSPNVLLVFPSHHGSNMLWHNIRILLILFVTLLVCTFYGHMKISDSIMARTSPICMHASIQQYQNHRNYSVTQKPGQSWIMLKQPYYRLTNEQQVMTTRVVLLAYYRGGSSFLGEIFAQNPEVFY